MKGLTRRQSNQSKKAEIINHYYQWLILKPSGIRKTKRSFTVSARTPKWREGERYFERYYRNGSSPWFCEMKMNRRAFVSINRMRAGHSILKVSLSRLHIVSTAECECGDGLKTKEHIFWACKLYEDQRAKMDILSEIRKKKEYPQSVTELVRLEKTDLFKASVTSQTEFLNLFKKWERSKCTKY
jgi:hypothetical protein